MINRSGGSSSGSVTVPAASAVIGSRYRAPERVGIVGAGMVGLSTAWFLQEHGVQVTVLERDHVAAGSSWGNAGWVTPSLATPLPEPAVLRYGVRAVMSPASPVYVPPRADPRLLRFLAGFARNSTARRWRAAMEHLVPVNRRAFEAFDQLAAGGVRVPTSSAEPFLACYRSAREREMLVTELAEIRAAGQKVDFELLGGAQVRALQPVLTDEINAAVRIDGQRFCDPGRFVAALADSVRVRGGELREGVDVRGIRDRGADIAVELATGESALFDAVVVASGAWLSELAQPFGVRLPVQAGRGYSFSVAAHAVPAGPLYFPAQRVACTPLGDRLRIAGMMEFREPRAPLDQRRITAIVDAVRPLLAGVELASRRQEWVGSRPCTPDGLPVIGRTTSPRLFVAGGHGMWGITLGPVSGQLVAQALATGRLPAELEPFDPLR
ncbi:MULTISPECIES: NAD(P)/FAD-dependent oxidoreductase [Protofrankia]|uniref:D-amino-acid dehydrogenase n=1 Tax=Candidatus Protofrankia datiscae TaxID=2716812 RepID=F8B3V8_9ACTN|nr:MULTISPECIES: FAD-dependent oxidoreductase [Protofrankia]AEH09055.1 D-amino-acid dehydrogenase [Candidatus Protofrankia datiscae]